jgi:hypothetical protein
MKSTAVLFVALVTLMFPRSLYSAAIPDHDDVKFVYAIHAICGFGATSINVLNPSERTVTLTKRGIPLLGQTPTPAHGQQQDTLKPNSAFLMSCDDILGLAGNSPTGASDILIGSDHELEVWAIYTVFVAGGGVGDTRIVHIDASQARK